MKSPWMFLRARLLGILTVACVAMAAQMSWAEDPELVLKLYAKEFSIEPSVTNVREGPVRILVINEGTMAHALTIEGREGTLVGVAPGKTAQVTVNLKEGEYVFYCPKRGHREKGMVGRVKVYRKSYNERG